MVNSPSFQLYKMKRAITTLGQDFTFTRDSVDEFGEPTGEAQEFVVKCIYHEHYENLFLRQTTQDSSVIRTKASPKLTCLWDDASGLKNTDTVAINDKTFRIGDIKNLVEANLIAAISLEVIEDGQQ